MKHEQAKLHEQKTHVQQKVDPQRNLLHTG